MQDLKSNTFIGIVEDNKDPKKLGRCRIRVINFYDGIPKEDLPWATPWKDLNGNSFILPELGKMVTVVFDQGNIYKPEYIYAEHYNRNLEDKLNSLSGDNYVSMRALLYDHKTQIYVNDDEGLKIDYMYNNINIEQNTISLNLKDNNANLNLGDAKASQQTILGNHFLDWFDDFMQILVYNTYLSSTPGSPTMPHPKLTEHMFKYFRLREPVFLSHHVRVVDNEAISAVANTSDSFPVHRFNFGQIGDFWKSLKLPNLFAKKIKDAPRPKKKRKKRFDPKYKSPQRRKPLGVVTNPQNPGTSGGGAGQGGVGVGQQGGIGQQQSSPPIQNVNNPNEARPSDGINNPSTSEFSAQNSQNLNPQKVIEFYEEEDEVPKLIRYMESKSGASPVSGRTEDYILFEDPYIMNIIVFRNRKHEYGTITNAFDDELWMFYKNEKRQWETIKKYTITSVPGYKVEDGKKIDPPVLPDGVCFINYGQYVNSYKLGYHSPEDYGKRHPALICDKVGMRVNKLRGRLIKDRYVNTTLNTQSGINIDGWVYDTGINIHCALPTDESVFGDPNFPKSGIIFDEVNNWSEGCIVFNNPEQYREFIGLCEEQRIKGKKSQFTVTVASMREFELFETDSSADDDDSNESNSLRLEDRFPDFPEDDSY